MDIMDPTEIASQQPGGQRGEDRKADQIVYELTRYNVTVGTAVN